MNLRWITGLIQKEDAFLQIQIETGRERCTMRGLLEQREGDWDSESLLSAQGSVPVKIMVQESHQVVQVEIGRVQHNFSSHFSEQIKSLEKKFNGQRSIESLPELPDGKGLFCWYDPLRPVSFLNELLRSAKNKSTTMHLSQKDLKVVLEYCNYNGWILYVSAKETAKVSFKILAHLAENGWRLPQAAVDVVTREVKKGQRHTINYALLALAHLTNNGQSSQTIVTCLDQGIRCLQQLAEKGHLESLVIALAAKANLSIRLSEEEQNLLKIGLVEPNRYPSTVFFYPKSDLCLPHSHSSISRWDWYRTITDQGTLELIRDHAKSHHKLSKREFGLMIKRWEGSTSVPLKMCIIDGFRYAIINGQRQFPNQDKALQILNLALTDPDIDLRQSARVATQYLLVNKAITPSSKLHDSLMHALERQHGFALKSFCHVLNNYGPQGFVDTMGWIVFFSALTTDFALSSKLQNTAKYICYRLEGKVDNLEKLVLNPAYCVEITETLCIAAENGQKLSTSLLAKLFHIIESKFPEEAQLHALSTFRYVAKNKQEIPQDVLLVFIKNYLNVPHVIIQNIMLLMMADCMDQHGVYLKKYLVSNLLSLTTQAELFENVIFVFSNMVDSADDLKTTERFNFESIANHLIQVLSLQCTKKQGSLIVLLLGKALEKEFIYSELNIQNLMSAMSLFADDVSTRLQILQIIGRSIQIHSQIQLPENFYEKLLQLCRSDNENERQDAIYVLESYIRHTPKLSYHTMATIESFIVDKSSFFLGCQLLNALIEKKYEIAKKTQCFLCDNVHQPTHGANNLAIATLEAISCYQPIAFLVLEKLSHYVDASSVEMTESCITILDNQRKYGSELIVSLFKSTRQHVHLIQIMRAYGFSRASKTKTITILLTLSESASIYFSVDFFRELIRLIAHNEPKTQGAALRLLKNKIPNMQQLFFNKNPIIKKLLKALSRQIYHENYQNLVLENLRDFAMAGACIAEVIPSETMTDIARILMVAEPPRVRGHIVDLLKKYGSLKEEAKTIYEVELLAKQLQKNSIGLIDKAFNALIKRVNEQEHMTVGVFVGLKMLIENQHEPVFPKLITLSLALQARGELLPVYLVLAMSQSMVNQPRHAFCNEFARIISIAILNNQSFSYETYLSLEQLLHTKDIEEHVVLYIIEALEVAAKREFMIKESTINQLFKLANTKDSRLTLPAVRLLLVLYQSEKTPTTQLYSIKKLLSFLKNGMNQALTEATYKLIYYMSQHSATDVETLVLIQAQIENAKGCDKQLLFNILNGLAKNTTLPLSCQITLQYKEKEAYFLSDDTGMEEKINLVRELLEKTHLVSGDTLLHLAEVIETIDNPLIFSDILKALVSLPELVPNALLVGIIRHLFIPQHSVIVTDFLIHVVKNKQHPFSEEALGYLHAMLVITPQEKIAVQLVNLLKNIQKYQHIPDSVSLQLQLEELVLDNDSKVDLLSVTQSFQCAGCSLSVANLKGRLQVLKKDPSLIDDVIVLLSESKESLSDEQVHYTVNKLVDYLKENDNASTAALCAYWLTTRNFPNLFVMTIFRKIDEHLKTISLNNGILTPSLLTVLESANYLHPKKETLYKSLIDYFFVTKSSATQKHILSMMLQYLYLAKGRASKEFMEHLLRIKEVFADEERFLNVVSMWLAPTWFPKVDCVYSAEVTAEAAAVLIHLLNYFQGTNAISSTHFCNAIAEKIKKQEFGKQFLILINQVTLQARVRLMLTFFSISPAVDRCILFQLMPQDFEGHLLIAELIALSTHKPYTENQINIFYSALKQRKTNNQVENFLRLLILNKKTNQLTEDELVEAMLMQQDLEEVACLPAQFNFIELRGYWIQHLLQKLAPKVVIAEAILWELDAFFRERHWEREAIRHFLKHLKIEKNYEELYAFINFCDQYALPSDLILSLDYKQFSLKELADQILINQLYVAVNECVLNTYSEKVFAKAKGLYEHGWDLNRLIQFFSDLSQQKKAILPKSVYEWMSMVFRYREIFSEASFYQLYNQSKTLKTFTSQLHSHIIDKHFSSAVLEHSLAELLQLVTDDAFPGSKGYIESIIEQRDIKKFFKHITEIYSANHSGFLIRQQAICLWTKEDVSAWAKAFKAYRKTNELSEEQLLMSPHIAAEVFAVLKRACVVQFEHEPRVAQLLSVFLLTHGKQEHYGQLAQIATGEGKSIIIAMLAVFKTLCGKKVDVITSSPLLAERDAEAFEPFYALFSLKSASTIDEDYKSGLKACYKSDVDIIYGDISNFQFDTLREEYSRLGTRGNRGFDEVIMDEVDNLLIDEGSKIAMLSTVMPSLDELHYFLTLIWLQLKMLNTLQHNPEQGFAHYPNPFYDIHHMAIELKEKKKLILKKISVLLESYIDEVILNPISSLQIPNHLRPFISHQKHKWVHCAMVAFYEYQIKKHYKVKKNNQGTESIIPVDFSNTGVVQQGTMWGDGLHQFLQIKHGLKVTPENITTNFLSNLAYIRRYKANLTGITGTLGSEKSQELLNSLYGNDVDCQGIDFIKIPTFLPNALVELPLELASNGEEWLQSIKDSVISEANQGRVCLVICETINDAEKLRTSLHKFTGTLHYYADNLQDHGNFFDKTQQSNTIIIATNLAGRGTDIKLSKEAIRHGGLHLCVSFLPINVRVGKQVLGRAGRRGEPGTAQIIINKENLRACLHSASEHDLQKLDTDPSFVNVLRDNEEQLRLRAICDKELVTIDLKDALFANFIKFLKQLDTIDKARNKKTGFSVLDFKPSVLVQNHYDAENQRYKRIALEEAWGFWLKEMDFEKPASQIQSLFETFKQTMLQQYENNTIIKNPIYYTKLGNALLSHANTFAYKIYHAEFCRLAIVAYDCAIELDRSYAYNAIYHKAYALTRLAKPGFKQQVKLLHEELLSKLKSLILQEESVLNLLMQDGQCRNEFSSQEHYMQIQNSVQVYQLFHSTIVNSLQQINQSLKLIDLKFTGSQECYQKNLLQADAIRILESHQDHGLVAVSFNHLKTHKDLWDSSQLNATVKQIPSGSPISLVFDSKKLMAPHGTKEALIKLLPINRYKDMTTPTQDMTLPATSKEPLFGAMEHITYAASNAYKKGSSLVGKISDGLSAVAKPVSDYKKHLKDVYYRYQIIEPLTLCLAFKLDNLISANSVFASCQNLNDPSYDFAITNPSIELIYHLQVRVNLPLSLKQLKHEEQNCQVYQDIALHSLQFNPSVLYKFSVVQLKQVRGQQLCILINYLQTQEGQSLLSQCSETLFELKIRGVEQSEATLIIQNHDFDLQLSYERLNTWEAESLLFLTANQHDAVVMRVEELTPLAAAKLIRLADRKEEGLTPKHKAIQTELIKINNDKEFSNNFALNGYFYLYELNENNPLPWKSLVMLIAMSSAQIAGGIALATFSSGIGASMGFTCIAEGMNDLVRAATTFTTREFSLSSFLTQKSLSLSISLSMAGLAHAYSGADSLSTGNQLLEAALEYGDEIVMGTLMSSEAVKDITKQGIKEALKKGAIALSENVTIEAATRVIHGSSNYLLDKSKYEVMNAMTRESQILFGNQRWEDILAKAFAVDKFIQKKQGQTFLAAIESKARQLIQQLDFSVPNLKLTDEGALAKFQTEFDMYLCELNVQLSLFEGVLGSKFLQLEPKKIRTICQCLQENQILDRHGINLGRLVTAYSPMKNTKDPAQFVEAYYHIENYQLEKIGWDADVLDYRSMVIEACLFYDRCVKDDYSYQYRRFTKEMANLLSDHVMNSLGLVAEVSKGALGIGVSVGVNQASDALTGKKGAKIDLLASDSGAKHASKVYPPIHRGQPGVPVFVPPPGVGGRVQSPPFVFNPTPGVRGQSIPIFVPPPGAGRRVQLPFPVFNPMPGGRGQSIPIFVPPPGAGRRVQLPFPVFPKTTVEGRLKDAIHIRSELPNHRLYGKEYLGEGRGKVHLKSEYPGLHDRRPLHNRNNFFPKPRHTPAAAINMTSLRTAGLIIDSATSIVNLTITEIQLWIMEAENKNSLQIYQNKMDKLITELESIELEERQSVANTIDINKAKQKNKIFQELEEIETKLNTEMECMKQNFAKIDEYTYSHASQIIKNNTQQAKSSFQQPHSFFHNLAFSDLTHFEHDPLDTLDISSPLKKKKDNIINQLMSSSTGLNHMVGKYGEIRQIKLELKKQLALIKIGKDYQTLFEEQKTKQAYRKGLIEKARCDLNATEIQHQISKFYKFYQQNSKIESELIRSALEQKKIELLIINRCDEDSSKLSTPGLS